MIDFDALIPVGETTLREDEYTTIRLANGDELTVTGDGQMSAYVRNATETPFSQELIDFSGMVAISQV